MWSTFRTLAFWWLLLATSGLATGCGFNPKFVDGTIPCKTNVDCPSGMTCASGTFCYGIGGDGAVDSRVVTASDATFDAKKDADPAAKDTSDGVDGETSGDASVSSDASAAGDVATTDASPDLSGSSDAVNDSSLGDKPSSVDTGAADRTPDATTTVDAACPDGCALGDKRCASAGLQTCVMVGTCPTWSVAAPCMGRLTCQGVAPASQCQCPAKPAGCEGGAGNSCAAGLHKLCQVDADGCVYEVSSNMCPASTPCGGTFPNANCTCPTPPTSCSGQAGSRCQDTQTLASCSMNAWGCLVADAPVTCPAGKPCTGNAPSASCSCGALPADCAAGAGKSCRSDGQLVTCAVDATSGCVTVMTAAPCTAGLTCQGAAPNATCKCPATPTECANGVGTTCQGTTGFVTCARDGNGCLVSRGATTCPTGKTCTGTAPSAMCTCPATPAECQAGAGSLCSATGTLVKCDNDAVSGCLSITSNTPCTNGTQCGGSFPAATCACPTAPAGCTAGVGRTCSGTNVLTCTRPAGGCFQVAPSTCPATKPCGGAFPTADCTCPTTSCAAVGSSCSGNTLITCSADANQCLQAVTLGCGTTKYCTGSAPTADCLAPTSLGYPADLGSMSNKSAGFLSGQSVAVSSAMIIRGFGLISRQSGTSVAIGIYTDVGGNPSVLIAKAEFPAVAAGRNEYVAVPASTGGSLALAAGTYWIMALYDGPTSIAAEATGATSVNRRLVSAGFGALPLSLTAMTITAQNSQPATNYYILVTP